MSDLLAPILFIMEDKVDAFWCFVGLMDRMESNFHKDQRGMHTQLLQLSTLIKVYDKQLFDYFKQNECEKLFFCFRWLLIDFKREFSFTQIMSLWEVIWSCHLSNNFQLFIALALLHKNRRNIIDEKLDFDGILKYINDLAHKIDVEETLINAISLCEKLNENCTEELKDLFITAQK